MFLMAALSLLASCSHTTPRFTPASVMPPPAAEAGIETPAPLPERTKPLETPAADPEAVPLTRDGAILTGLLHNRAIDVSRLNPVIGATFIPEARAAFDPRILSTISRGRSRDF